MSTLSLAMIVKNEESNLKRCLDSVVGLFDEIVVVDTGSTDNTKSSALLFNAKIYDFKWIDDFSAARNFSFSKCNSEYIMWLDADDIILPHHISELLKFKQQLHASDTFLLPYHYAFDENSKPIVTLHTHRIVKRSLGLKWKYPIHECLQVSSSHSQVLVGIPITHKRSIQDAISDRGRNLRLLKNAVAIDRNDQRLKFYYAKELFNEGLLRESLSELNDYFKLDGWHDDQMYGHYIMAMIYVQLGENENAISCAMKAIKQDPRWAEFYVVIGQIHYDKECWLQAIWWFELATRTPVPDTIGIVMLDNYTWIPYDRLCKCYSQVGRLKEAYEMNEVALYHKPTDKRLLYNREFLRNHLFPSRIADRPIRLSLGSGGKHTNSYICTDKYVAPNVVELVDQISTPYDTGTVHAIYSEHALEHANGHIDAERAIVEWSRILRHGGHLWLKVPDLDVCCRLFVESEDRDRLPNERWTPKEWYKYTIYGIQTSQNGEPDHAQYHRTGFTKESLNRMLCNNGFEVKSLNNYDGYGTPSIEVKAIQTKQKIKVAWITSGAADENNGSWRIRRLNIHKWLLNNNVDSQLVDCSIISDVQKAYHADVCVFISFGPTERELIDKLKRRGIKCVIDHCEDLFGLPYQTECFESVDAIVCCSTVLADKTTTYGRTIMIPDACEELC